MDPRVKIQGFHNVLQILSQTIGVNYSNYFSEVRAELYKLYNKYENKYGAVRLLRPSNISRSTGKKKTAWGMIFGARGAPCSTLVGSDSTSAPSPSASTPAIATVSELSAYLDSDTITCYDDDFNILHWWHEHKLTYPILAILARDVMSVPVSTVSSESCWQGIC